MAKRFMGGEVVSNIAPAGSVTAFAGETAPDGWLLCDGSPVSRSEYPSLFAALGVIYGNGDGSTTFNLPDYRGQFLRGRDASAGNDPDAASRTDRGDGQSGDKVGTRQGHEIGSHRHSRPDASTNTSGTDWVGAKGASQKVTRQTGYAGGNETRPKNIAVNYIIKY